MNSWDEGGSNIVRACVANGMDLEAIAAALGMTPEMVEQVYAKEIEEGNDEVRGLVIKSLSRLAGSAKDQGIRHEASILLFELRRKRLT